MVLVSEFFHDDCPKVSQDEGGRLQLLSQRVVEIQIEGYWKGQ